MRPPEPSMFSGDGTAVIVLGHGSKAPAALEVLNWVAKRLAARLQMPVLAASLQFNKPSLEESCRELAEAGARRIVVAPYFLFTGNHMMKDIPGILDQLREELPGTEFILADALGADDLMVEVLARRALAKCGAEEPNGAARQQDVARESSAAARQPDVAGDSSDAADLFASIFNDACGGSCSGSQPIVQHPIETESFEIIDSLLEPDDVEDPGYQVVRRIVHTTGDPSLARAVMLSDSAISAGVAAAGTGAGIYCDVNMAAAGIKPTAEKLGLEVTCLVADPAVAELARSEGVTRGVAAVRLAASSVAGGTAVTAGHGTQTGAVGSGLDGAIAVIGNSPTALFELLRLAAEERIRPALIVGVPVGFVGAAESKEALIESDIPYITLPGNRGGSTIAVAVVNAIMRMSTEQK
ncbi:MAG: precorrin-8X methylmutase [Actinobacteria bacterium]|nr:precorrin-8X methylmutase [Actinomycetota bacterium]